MAKKYPRCKYVDTEPYAMDCPWCMCNTKQMRCTYIGEVCPRYGTDKSQPVEKGE